MTSKCIGGRQSLKSSLSCFIWLVLVVLIKPVHAEEPSVAQSSPAENAGESAAPDTAAGRVLPLEEAYRLALTNEEQIKIAERELAKAQLLPWRAYAQLTPNANIVGTYTRNKEEISFIREPTLPGQTGTPSTIRPGESWQGLFTVTQPLIQPSFPPSLQLGRDSVRQTLQRYYFTIR